MQGPPNVRLSVSSRPENVVLVRQVLTGLAEAIGVDAADLNDIATAVTEACNNVVLHAYPQDAGPLEVEIHARPAAIEVVVRDRGRGIQTPITQARDARGIGSGGIGLSVIKALSQRAEFRATQERGSEVWMTFATPRARVLDPVPDTETERSSIMEPALAGTMQITVAPSTLSRTILPRLLSVAAARAHFTTDRLADTQLVADALTDRLSESTSGSRLLIAISIEPRELRLRLAPLLAGHAHRLVVDAALEGLGPVVEKLTTDYEVATVGSNDDELLALRLVDHR